MLESSSSFTRMFPFSVHSGPKESGQIRLAIYSPLAMGHSDHEDEHGSAQSNTSIGREDGKCPVWLCCWHRFRTMGLT